jgi:hypothetical protein
MKSNINTDPAQLKIISALGRKIEPPQHMTLTSEERKHFYAVTQELAKSEITPMLLELCAIIASNLARIEAHKRELKLESELVVAPSGRLVANARISIIRGLTSDIVKLRTHLLSAATEAKAKRAQRVVAKQMERQAEEALNGKENGSANLL